jgi:MoxR-like ATPase
MLPPSADSSPVSDAFKARITSLIQEQLKPIVTELAAQQRTLLNNLALLKHNHNVNDYQMTRLENIRDLEQSIKYAFHCRPSLDHVTDRAASQL